jgi:hypothetical protein
MPADRLAISELRKSRQKFRKRLHILS